MRDNRTDRSCRSRIRILLSLTSYSWKLRKLFISKLFWEISFSPHTLQTSNWNTLALNTQVVYSLLWMEIYFVAWATKGHPHLQQEPLHKQTKGVSGVMREECVRIHALSQYLHQRLLTKSRFRDLGCQTSINFLNWLSSTLSAHQSPGHHALPPPMTINQYPLLAMGSFNELDNQNQWNSPYPVCVILGRFHSTKSQPIK